MSLLKKVQKRSVERKFGGTHPILRMGFDRNVIDAYFTGLVFAAVADDEAVDEAERAKLEKIGLALNLSPEDFRGAVDEMLARDGDAKVAVAEEAAGALRGTDAIQLFLCEWTQIWMSHEYQADELNEFRRQLCEWMGCEYDEEIFNVLDAIMVARDGEDAHIRKLFGKIPDDHLAYLFGGEELIQKERELLEQEKIAEAQERAEAEKKAKEVAAERQKEFVATFCQKMDILCSKFYKLPRVKNQHLEAMRSTLGNLTEENYSALLSEVKSRFDADNAAFEEVYLKTKNKTKNTFDVCCGMSHRDRTRKSRGFIGAIASMGVLTQTTNSISFKEIWAPALRKGAWSLVCIAACRGCKTIDELNRVLDKVRLTIGGNIHTPATLRKFWEAEVLQRFAPVAV